MIKFKLKDIDEVSPFGSENEQEVHWFALTDGVYWIELENTTLFEYTNEILDHWKIDRENKYTDYQIARFYEDFTELFYKIPESIPNNLFELIDSTELLNKWNRKVDSWIENDAIEEGDLNFIAHRTLDSGHLQYSPMISFFRKGDKIRLIWDAGDIIDNKIPVWTASTGELDMNYQDFINQVEEFGRNFFHKMETQVQRAVEKDWGNIRINKTRVLEEHAERIDHFKHSIDLLEKDEILFKTDWVGIKKLLEKIKK